MYRNFVFPRSVMAVAAFLASICLSSPAMAGPVVNVAIGTPPIVVSTPEVRIAVRPARPALGWTWVHGYWSHPRPGHRVWVAGYWAPPTRVVQVRRVVPVTQHRTHTRRVIVRGR